MGEARASSATVGTRGSPPRHRRRTDGPEAPPLLNLQGDDVEEALSASLASTGLGSAPVEAGRARPGSVAANAVRRELRVAPPPAPASEPPPSAFAGGVVVCPICEYFPTGHSIHGVAGCVSWSYCPLSHSGHSVVPAVVCVPGGHKALA